MPAIVSVDGRLVPKLAATVSALDHGLLFGDGVAVGLRLYRGEPFRLADHLKRLAEVAARVSLKLPHTADEFAALIRSTVAASGRTEGFVKLVVTRGAGTVGFDPRKCVPGVVVIVDDLLPVPPELREFGLSVATATSVRRHVGHPTDWGGTLNALVPVLATRDAYAAGCLEALILDDAGLVTGPTDGVLVVRRDGRWQTPRLDTHPDPVMLAVLGELLPELDAIDMLPADWPGVTEAFLASSATEWAPIRVVDGVALPTPIGPDTETGQVFRALRSLTRGEDSPENPETPLADD